MEGQKTMPINAERPKDSPTVVIGYTNWRGEYGEREIVPMHPWFGATDWHPELQWLLKAWDVAKDAERDFAIKDIGSAAKVRAIREGDGEVCATEGCGNAATERFESGGVGSIHCPSCIANIAAIAASPTDNLEAGAGDLVARLRSRKGEAITRTERLMDEAADYIEEAAAQLAAVTAENARLREAIAEIADFDPEGPFDPGTLRLIRIAGAARRAALPQEAPK